MIGGVNINELEINYNFHYCQQFNSFLGEMVRVTPVGVLTITIVFLATFLDAKISTPLLATLHNGKTANVIVNFVGGNSFVVTSFEKTHFDTRTERLNTLKLALEQHSQQVQQHVVQFLEEKAVSYKSFWISNQLYIPGADGEVVEALSLFREVEEIHEEKLIPVAEAERVQAGPTVTRDVGWNLERIQVAEAWNITKGEGVVVSHIDTGARHTHEALVGNFRGVEYGWLDPYENTTIPLDDDGRGTHMMGTIAGAGGIGIAPNSTWIACKGCNLTTCTEANLITCGQWILCPTKLNGSDPDCSKAPAVTSCSWGIGRGDSWYEAVTRAWIAARIIPVFAFGNSGPTCGSTNSPGDYDSVIGVGWTMPDDSVSNYSSAGPTPDGRLKPDLVAPAEEIYSALPDSDVAYGIKRGASMTAPHVTGAVALILSVRSNLTFEAVRRILNQGVDTNVPSSNQSCNGIPDTSFPNYQFGYGRVNVLKAVQAAQLYQPI